MRLLQARFAGHSMSVYMNDVIFGICALVYKKPSNGPR